MLTYYISVWYAGCSAVDIKALRGVVKSAVKILIPHFVYFVFIFIYIFTLFIVFILHPVILLLHQTELRLQFGCMLSLQWQQGHSDSDIVPLNICLSIYIKTPRLTTFIAQSDIPEVDIAHSQRLQPRIYWNFHSIDVCNHCQLQHTVITASKIAGCSLSPLAYN